MMFFNLYLSIKSPHTSIVSSKTGLWLCCKNLVSCSSGRCTCFFSSQPAVTICLQQDSEDCSRTSVCARPEKSSGCSSFILLPAGLTCCVSGGRWVLSCSSFYCVVSELYRFQILPILYFVYKLAKEIKGELKCSEIQIFKHHS